MAHGCPPLQVALEMPERTGLTGQDPSREGPVHPISRFHGVHRSLALLEGTTGKSGARDGSVRPADPGRHLGDIQLLLAWASESSLWFFRLPLRDIWAEGGVGATEWQPRVTCTLGDFQ